MIQELRIHVLTDQVINKIAAGEVVERPASVVKELVENSLDADASSVQIILQAGGRDLIEVIDDGSGMSPEEARLAIQRHATSKIESEEDLADLVTYGFRGEALPSIASVSRLTLETSEGEAEGIRIRVEGGRKSSEEPAARTRGTTVRVEHLFANVPARRKFLRTVQTEYRHALAAVNEAALARLDVAFRLIHEEREVYRVPAGEGLRERARTLFSGRSVEGSMTLASEAAGMRLRGLLGHPDAARRSSSGVHLFVNGRPVGHRGLAYALYTGYGELLGDGSYPFACLFLEVPAEAVDVNVHPAKREVRFRDEQAVKDFVITSVREVLSRELGARPLHLGAGGRSSGRTAGGTAPAGRTAERSEWHRDDLFKGLTEAAMRSAEGLFAVTAPESPLPGEAAEQAEGLPGSREGPTEEPSIWQVHDRYLLAPIKGGLLIVDQHAAHERVLYEEALAQLTGEAAVRQQLLFPRVLDLSAEQFALVEEIGPLLERVGFDVRAFGGHTVALEAVPPSLERAGREEEVFVTLLDDLEERGARGSGVQEKIAASLACHGAIRFGDRLRPEERRALVDKLFACERPQVCPHGRPTHMVLSLEELDRRFER